MTVVHSQTAIRGVNEIGVCGSHSQKLRLGPLTNGLCTHNWLMSSQLKCLSSILCLPILKTVKPCVVGFLFVCLL